MLQPPLRREGDGRVLGGVAGGLAAYLDVPVTLVRGAFALLALAGGAGLAAYAVFWVFLPQTNGTTLREDRRGQRELLMMVVLVGVTLAVLAPLHLVPGGTTALALLAAVVGVALVWQQADEAQRARWRTSATSGRSGTVRFVVGALLVAAGLVGFLASRGELANARTGFVSTTVAIGGLALLTSPWWVGLTDDLRAERTARIRSQEKAELAAHLHDSVLQTLTLIQKASGDPAEVTRLARGQERELRHWLYTERYDDATLVVALEAVAAEVEDALGPSVDVVVVGDTAVDERVGALVAATREAVLNAAKHSGAPSIDVYAEVEPGAISVFVRDRGCGFDQAAVAPDRHGLAGSVVGRMQRYGGTAEVRSAPGAGTEVRLVLPHG